MRLFSPERPLSDGMPLFAPGGTMQSRAHGLPALYVEPGAREGEWRVTIHMPNSYNAFSGYEAQIATTNDLGALFASWLDDPEKVIAETFKYTYNAKANLSRAKSIASERSVAAGLAELGLDDL